MRKITPLLLSILALAILGCNKQSEAPASTLSDMATGEILQDLTYEIPAESSLPIWDCCQKWLPDYKYTFRLAIGLEDSVLSLAVTDWVENREIILDE